MTPNHDAVEKLEREDRMVWRGVTADFLLDETTLIDFEGAFRVGKTTAALRKVLRSCLHYPGIQWLICRYSDGDTQTKLKPPWRAMCSRAGVRVSWDSTEQCDVFPPVDGKQSRVYIFGVKSQDQTSRYGKFRGMTLAGIYNDQTEELPHDVYQEMMGRLSQSGYPHQLLLTPNPPDPNHWLAREFPESNHLRNRKYYCAPIHANAHNLPPDTIERLVQVYPPSHPKHRSAILGMRGLNVVGKPVYGGDPEQGMMPSFSRALHVRPLAYNPHLPLLTVIDFGKHHPCMIFGQYTPWNQLMCLGGVMGQDMFLEDFAPTALRYRAQWFPDVLYHMEACDPAGAHDNSQGVRQNGIEVLKTFGIMPRYKENSNAPDVRLAMVERLAGLMRKRTTQGEAFGVEKDPEKWLLVTQDQARPWPFLADAFEAGYVWDEHYVSVGSKQLRKPKKDGWYEHGMNCCEYLELNFGGAQPSAKTTERQVEALSRAALKRAQRDSDPSDFGYGRLRAGRGGYV